MVVTSCPAGIRMMTPGNNIEIFPNPVTDELTIKMDQGAYTSFTITNSIGQKVLQQPLSSLQTNVNVNALTPGLYYVTFRGEQGSAIKKFVKK